MPRVLKNPLPDTQPPAQSIGLRLANLRKTAGLTQSQIADQIGIAQYLVSNYETGRLHLSDDMIIRFAKALGTSSDSILGLDTSEESEQPSLRLVRRMKRIQNLPASQQKALLQTIDLALEAAEGRISSSAT